MNSTIYGRISRDAELKESSSGTKFARFGVALTVYNKGGENGVTWVDAVVFGGQAESLAAYLTKGSSVALSGDLKLRTYDSERDGGTKTSLEIVVNSVALLGSPAKDAQSKPQSASRPQRARTVNEDAEDPDIGF